MRSTEPIEPYEGDIVRIVTIGTAIWFAVGLGLLPFWSVLNRHGHLWWVATCACAVGLGLLGRSVCIKRARRLGLRP